MRLLRAVLVFVGTSVALLVVAAQFAPGWRPGVAEAPLDPQPLNPRQSITYEIERIDVDGHAWVVKPMTTSNVPALVLVHGAGSKDRDELLGFAESLARKGIAAITYDKRDYSFFRRDFAALADNAREAADVLAAQPGIDKNRLGMLGFSEGGWVVPLALQREPERYAFAAFLSPSFVTPLEQVAWTADRSVAWAPEFVRRVPATALASGRTVADFLDFDVEPALRQLRVPTYAIWGADDAIVPVATAVRVLTTNVAPATVRVLPDTGHSPTGDDWITDLAGWITALPSSAVEEVRGVEPATLAGPPTPPENAWFLNPLGHFVIALALAIAAFRRPKRQ
ncbi:alpha/beta hydrolase family protein [Tenggerimyces flavus]|uniref:Alpha/beta hydrolase family protein n=1 Tax=Tenggerimyces flavus TaxID=1708749 RepID=A0ABV7YH17_9ACTN|nr:alpha/beta fold hydrolase [Tenggerimyces flavus]MBM7785996.1 pimeloyl-ACP methyl ester carboxylesterase [Tenggerimyces flavus]